MYTAEGRKPKDGWLEVASSGVLHKEDVIRFDHDHKTYAIYRTADNTLFATDGVCTHGNAHLADGMVKGTLIECPKHNGRFDVRDGSPQRLPVCVALTTFDVREMDGAIELDLNSAGGLGRERTRTHLHFSRRQQRQRRHLHQRDGAGAGPGLAASGVSPGDTCSRYPRLRQAHAGAGDV
ncbi:MAG: Rieske 2Fe-2S domain-containing protein, partial [Anaerolineae bacterium]|nr:Rieske 2Fe-2S domain-containing protein [Anaerolineae bacterium]